MVEMLETAEILKAATPRSFVIMDEVGRGTAPNDGIAVAYACLHHLHEVNRCRTLFATHFHDVAKFAERLESVGCYCTDIEEVEGGGFTYVHQLRRGLNTESHALKVARLAGLPNETIRIAEQVLAYLRTQKIPAPDASSLTPSFSLPATPDVSMNLESTGQPQNLVE
ncbi:MutS protein 1 [Rhizina undulata]